MKTCLLEINTTISEVTTLWQDRNVYYYYYCARLYT